jgi:hypothetical protein
MSALSNLMTSSYSEAPAAVIPPPEQASQRLCSHPQPTTASSIAEYIDAAVVPYVSGSLISLRALSNIRPIASLLPGALTDFFGFECPLGVSEATADFLVCSRASQGGREILNGQRPGRDLPAFFQDEPVWQRIRSFSSEWFNPQSPLFDHVHNIWIEFDVEGTPPSIPVPSVFIGPNNLQPLGAAIDNGEMPRHCAWLTDSALPLLLGSKPDSPLRAQIARCTNLLPSGARIFQVGLMLARTSQTTRLCVRGVSGTQIIEYLGALGWDETLTELKQVVCSLLPFVDRIDLDLDVTDRVLPKIGLECYLAPNAAAVRRFLDYLVSSGLSTPVKAEALESWRGMAHERLTPDIWPKDLLAVSGFLGGRVHSIFARWLHHIKIVYRPALQLQAKAYLAVHHLWLAPAALKDLVKQAESGALEHEA